MNVLAVLATTPTVVDNIIAQIQPVIQMMIDIMTTVGVVASTASTFIFHTSSI